jgi:site-specific recombinase XerD
MRAGKSNCFISYNKLGPFTKLATSYIVEFMSRLSGMKRTGTTRARKLASLRHFLKFLKENDVIAGNR